MKKLITISREYGSGGRIVGKLLAEKLELPFYDKAIIDIEVEKRGFSSKIVENAELRAKSSFSYSLASAINFGDGVTSNPLSINEKIFLAQFDVIKSIGDLGEGVIVGRCADYILKDINFIAKKGETVAFIGSTGSGKSTLVSLIPRFYDTTEGEILVDGINVKEYKLDTLHNKIGYVPQKAVLFRGSVSSNVAYGDNGKNKSSHEEIKTALRIAQGSDFVEKMEKTYEAEISQAGANISGGQKQRLAIARAVCRKPELYVFDDSFSALDYKTDRILRSTLKKETAGVTSLIVAQRIGTIMDADQIIVLNEGMIVGKGNHKELLKTCDVYKEIAMSQLSEEELIS